ncbi:hypothetical protein GLYMA_08G070200v4 [Glycine max]|uniref:Uncharacterized protein n=2 Tax=Glycine subgen. Soja TaxID=1462606 RepID=A0A0R0II79_SOYBN|nr:uncharacterized protein LOC114421390 isoform X1 [Glycine soja]KAH1050024.1 hypothetical protein GYH30_020488 [Glycine max]KRH42118.1 hypothetical protein GLYMA_08G070200v4 [Glycine max]RZB95666.1 hypothetical protein D0Y65_019841 [Glycine soja]RZB95669.1 hypothetical protein D0Y65_019841 [Glycine soja]|eukprot:XP_014633807.1 uncharacterized protein LOC100305915 isoform X1 [Glycine max]
MSNRGSSWITLKFRGVVDVIRASRYQSNYVALQRNRPIVSAARTERGYWMHPGQQFYSTNSINPSTNPKGIKDVKPQAEALAPASKILTFSHWLRWVLGMVLSLLLPFWKPYWKKLQIVEVQTKQITWFVKWGQNVHSVEAEFVVEEAEAVAKMVEKVAMVTEKVSEDVAEMLPEDGKLRKAALVVERASKEAAHDAQLTEEFLHKVEELKNDLDDLEAFVEPVIDKIVKM